MTWKGIVNRRFSPDGFAAYVASLKFVNWRPLFVVLHNTGVPSLSQRPAGYADMLGNQRYYRDEKRWQAGPHLFVDQNGIFVFTPLTVSGTHSPSWNRVSWGVEMLGNYEAESFTSGPGAVVRAYSIAALAVLHIKAGLDSSSLRLHKEDPLTDHDCPGRKVIKADVIRRVHDEIVRRRAADAT